MFSISMQKRKARVKGLQTEMNNRSLIREREYLKKTLKASDYRKRITKLGGYVTDVDHSDLIVGGNLYNLGHTFLTTIGKDPQLLKTTQAFKIDEKDERFILETVNSLEMRENYFTNILKGFP